MQLGKRVHVDGNRCSRSQRATRISPSAAAGNDTSTGAHESRYPIIRRISG